MASHIRRLMTLNLLRGRRGREHFRVLPREKSGLWEKSELFFVFLAILNFELIESLSGEAPQTGDSRQRINPTGSQGFSFGRA